MGYLPPSHRVTRVSAGLFFVVISAGTSHVTDESNHPAADLAFAAVVSILWTVITANLRSV